MSGSSVPSTSNVSGGAGGNGNTNGGSGGNAVTSNGNNSGNVVPSRTLAGAGEGGLSVPTLAAVPSSRGSFASLSRPTASSGSRKKSLHPAPLYNGLLNSYEDKSNDFVCPICFEMIEEAHMTKCGHSFCFKCIRQSLEDSNRCPKCNYIVDNVDQLYPNFLVNELILKQKQRSEEKRLKLDHPNGSRWQVFQDVLSPDQENLDLANVNLMLELLVQKKKQLEANCAASQGRRNLMCIITLLMALLHKMTSSNVLFCPGLKDIQYNVIEEKRNQEIFPFEKLESKNKMTETD